MDRNECWYFNTVEGCRNGRNCPYIHRKKDPSKIPLCRFYKGPGTCRYEDHCFYRHVDVVNIPAKSASKAEAKESKPSRSSANSKDSASGGEDVRTIISGAGVESGLMKKKKKSPGKSYKKSPKGKEKYLSVKINNNVKDDSTPIKLAKQKVDQVSGAEGDSNNNALAVTNQNHGNIEEAGQNLEPQTYTCGECGLVVVDSCNTSDDENDALEEHYKEKLLKMDKAHLDFLKKDPRFKLPTSCGVCGRNLTNSYSLLRHITDKVKSKKNDWKMHEDFLGAIYQGLWERDLGLTDEAECIDWLMMHLVESYEGEGSDSDDSDDVDGIGALFGLMALGKLLQGAGVAHMGHDYEDDDSPDSDDYGNPYGMDDDDMYELACQGIKPWDPCAMDALAILNGDDDYDF